LRRRSALFSTFAKVQNISFMNLRHITSDSHPIKEFLIYLLLILIAGLLFNLIGGVLAAPLYGISLSAIMDGTAMQATPENAAFLKFYQIVNHIGMFTVPSLLFMALFMSRYDLSTLGLSGINFFTVLSGIVVLFAALPFTGMLIEWNQGMQLPGFLEGIEGKLRILEDSAGELTEVFFLDTSVKGLIINLIMIALIPAIGEELVFRGVLFRIFHKWIRNIHVVVIITSILFSAMHLQFYGFVPRMFLGLVFGYLFVYSRSLWVPIIAHFVNNGTAVTAEWFFRRNGGDLNAESFGSTDSGLVVLISIVMVIGIFFLMRRMHRFSE